VDREFVHKALVLPPPTQNRVAGYDYAYERETEERDRAIRWCYTFVTHGGLEYVNPSCPLKPVLSLKTPICP
jgi:hypothetical protein